MGFVDRVDAQRLYEAVAEIIRQFKRFAIRDIAAGFSEFRMTRRSYPLCLLVVSNNVRFKDLSLVIELHIAGGRNTFIVAVIYKFIGIDHERFRLFCRG